MFSFLWDALCMIAKLSWVLVNGILFGGLSLILFIQIRYTRFTCATLIPVAGYDDCFLESEE